MCPISAWASCQLQPPLRGFRKARRASPPVLASSSWLPSSCDLQEPLGGVGEGGSLFRAFRACHPSSHPCGRSSPWIPLPSSTPLPRRPCPLLKSSAGHDCCPASWPHLQPCDAGAVVHEVQEPGAQQLPHLLDALQQRQPLEGSVHLQEAGAKVYAGLACSRPFPPLRTTAHPSCFPPSAPSRASERCL